ncbi:MAG: FkbM family methyltransferase [Acidobacteriota bacterium]
MKRALKTLALLLILAGVVYIYPPIRLAALTLAGRSTVCPFSEAVRSAQNLSDQVDINRRMVKQSRMLEQDPAGFHLWDTPQGKYWIPAGSDYALPWDLAEQERKIYGTGARGVHPGDIVLDCGANVGVFTRVALKAGAKKVVAIEIAPENLECLRRNFKEEIAAGSVVLYPKGVWDKDDFLTLNVDPQNSAADSVVMRPESSRQGPRVELTTIDKLVGELKLERVDFIKMDIEGAEQHALRGGRATIAAYHPRMSLSAYHRPDDPVKIPELVKAAWPGYGMECGPCADAKTFIRPDVLYFY